MEGSDCKYGMVFDYSPQRFSTLLYQAGGSLLNEDMTASNINSPEMKKALNGLRSSMMKGLCQLPYGWEQKIPMKCSVPAR